MAFVLGLDRKNDWTRKMKVVVTKQIVENMKEFWEQYLEKSLEILTALQEESTKDAKLVEVKNKLLGSDVKLRIFKAIVFNPNITQKLLTTKLAVAKSNMSNYIGELESFELIVRARRGLIATSFGMRFFKEIKNIKSQELEPTATKDQPDTQQTKAEKLLNEWFSLTEDKPFSKIDFIGGLCSRLNISQDKAEKLLQELIENKKIKLADGELTK